jgi:hypothetical protein
MQTSSNFGLQRAIGREGRVRGEERQLTFHSRSVGRVRRRVKRPSIIRVGTSIASVLSSADRANQSIAAPSHRE